MITFIDPNKVPPKISPDGKEFWGYSYMRAGFKHIGYSKGGLVAMQLKQARIRDCVAPAINPEMSPKMLKSILSRRITNEQN